MSKIKMFIENNIPFVAQILRVVKSNTINRYKVKSQQKNLKLVGKEALEQLSQAFKELNKEWFLTYGTLLGAYRDKDFISHDVDIDIGVFFDDYSKDIELKLKEFGFTKKHMFVVDDGKFAIEETYDYKGVGVDIFYFKKEANRLIGYGFINEKGLSWDATIKKYGGVLVRELTFSYEGLEEIEFLGDNYLAPKNTFKHLAEHYGESFMQKDAKWNPHKVTNVRYLEDKKAKFVKVG